jgi:2-hydroxychromene-2-carboxylate isomerase
MKRHIDYFFTPVSPWTWLGHERLRAIARAAGATVSVKPVDYGVIFPASGGLPLARRAPQRQAYRLVELDRFRRHLGVTMNLQPKHFPVDAGRASRLIVAVEQADGAERALDLAGAMMRAVWAEERDLADPPTLAAIVAACGLPAERLAQSDAPGVAARYAAHTEQALAAGVFGAPTYVLEHGAGDGRSEIFWGQDRLDFLERALQGARA